MNHEWHFLYWDEPVFDNKEKGKEKGKEKEDDNEKEVD